MRRVLASVAFVFSTTPAPAQPVCPAGAVPILSCTFSDGAKALLACQDGTTARYAFGKAGKVPDLALAVPVLSLGYHPWPGIGRTIWEEAIFSNEGVDYLLWHGFDRMAPEAEALTAGIVVQRDGEELARLDCDQGSISPGIEQLWDVFTAAGQCYDQPSRTWAPCAQ